jgi:hypothetical protein
MFRRRWTLSSQIHAAVCRFGFGRAWQMANRTDKKSQ